VLFRSLLVADSLTSKCPLKLRKIRKAKNSLETCTCQLVHVSIVVHTRFCASCGKPEPLRKSINDVAPGLAKLQVSTKLLLSSVLLKFAKIAREKVHAKLVRASCQCSSWYICVHLHHIFLVRVA